MIHRTSLLASSVFFLSLGLQSVSAEKIDFGKDVYPILKESCLRCHAEAYEDKRGRLKKPKGGLRLDTAEWIMKGYVNDEGETEKVVFPGDPEASEFYTLTLLPEDHDDVMPPSGDPLTKEQTEVFRLWIEQGAEFGDFVAPKYINPKSKEAAEE